MIQNVMEISTPFEDVAALERRTEGWIAGLQLAAVSMQHQKDPSCFIQALTGRFTRSGQRVVRAE